jgi:hypothetical protein
MSLVLQSSGGGQVTIQEPTTASNFTQTLPAATGTVALLQTPAFATTIGVGGATPAASGAGITFPATQSASSDANTLDDYEEGTWTPNLIPNTGTITSQSVSGSYVRIGRVVTVTFVALITGGTVSVINQIAGLPFSVSDQNYVSAACREFYSTGLVWAATGQNGGSYILLNRYDNTQVCGVNYGWGGTYTYLTNA